MGRILVTGIGVISSIGDSVAENRLSLINKKCGLSDLEGFDSRFAHIMPFGEIKIPNSAFAEKYQLFQNGITRPCFLALHAFNEALADAGLSAETCKDPGTALVNASTVGGMCLTDELYHDANTDTGGSPWLNSYDCASISFFLQEHFNMEGNISTINTACSSSANAIAYGARLIKNGLATRVIAGGVDCLAKYTINGFNALHILSKEKCRPFDAGRNGLNLGEAAAYLVMEKEEDAKDKKIYAAISGYCNANDAFHPSSLSENGDGPFLAMQGALDKAGLSPEEIGFINAHGTGTENNDEVEGKAMIRLFGTPPAFISTKANTGHTLGAAGALEAAFCILNLYHQDIFPAIQFEKPIPSTGLIPNGSYHSAVLSHVMTNSFGFGGNCTSLVFSKHEL